MRVAGKPALDDDIKAQAEAEAGPLAQEGDARAVLQRLRQQGHNNVAIALQVMTDRNR